MMNDTQQAALSTALNTAEQLAPVVANAAAAATGNPTVALVANLTPLAIETLQAALALHTAGGMSASDLAALWTTVGQGIASSHNAWVAMNSAAAK